MVLRGRRGLGFGVSCISRSSAFDVASLVEVHRLVRFYLWSARVAVAGKTCAFHERVEITSLTEKLLAVREPGLLQLGTLKYWQQEGGELTRQGQNLVAGAIRRFNG